MAPGQPLLLAALVAHDLLVIHPASTVTRLLADLHAEVIGSVMSADPARVATARQLLSHLGVTLADLQAEPAPRLPTLAEYLPQVIAAAGTGARRTYGTYWNRMAAAWGERVLDAIAASDVEAMQRQIAATARSRRNSRSGRHTGEHVIAAARALYNRAIADGLIDAAASPAHRVVKRRRLPTTRRALAPDELAEINLAARTSGNDVGARRAAVAPAYRDRLPARRGARG